ncbi:MAG: hypothetical protein GEU98_08045 [Pseudonocardiaceae bacterium]|nr:hypothetical protein [Pseudonocardiaceae bacterium]
MQHSLSVALAALPLVAPTARTACAGWTAHELRAHLAAGASERAAAVEHAVTGTARPRVRYEEFLALPDDRLRAAVVLQARRVERLARCANGSALVGGTRFSAARLLTHQNSEAAIHCWDLLGADGINDAVLARPELTEHAVFLGDVLPGPGTARVLLRSPGRADVLWHGGRAEFADGASANVVLDTDPAQRLLLLWGRRPTARPVRPRGLDHGSREPSSG